MLQFNRSTYFFHLPSEFDRLSDTLFNGARRRLALFRTPHRRIVNGVDVPVDVGV